MNEESTDIIAMLKGVKQLTENQILKETKVKVENRQVSKYNLNFKLKNALVNVSQLGRTKLVVDHFSVLTDASPRVVVSFDLPKFVPVCVRNKELFTNIVENKSEAIIKAVLGRDKQIINEKVTEETVFSFEGDKYHLTYSIELKALICYNKQNFFSIGEKCSFELGKYLNDKLRAAPSFREAFIKFLSNTILIGKFVTNERIFVYEDSVLPCFLVSYGLDKSSGRIVELGSIVSVLAKIGIYLAPRQKEEVNYSQFTQAQRTEKLRDRGIKGCKAALILLKNSEGTVKFHYKVYLKDYEWLKRMKVAYFKDNIQNSGASKKNNRLGKLSKEIEESGDSRRFFCQLIEKLDSSFVSAEAAIKEALKEVKQDYLSPCFIFEKSSQEDETDKQTTNVEDYEKILLLQSRKLMSINNSDPTKIVPI